MKIGQAMQTLKYYFVENHCYDFLMSIQMTKKHFKKINGGQSKNFMPCFQKSNNSLFQINNYPKESDLFV